MNQKFLDKLHKAALVGFNSAYAPYSKFHVGAAILADDGNIYAGSNVENAAFPQGNCAEASAISAMIYGGGRKIDIIMVVARADRPVSPCGGCRQRIGEFAQTGTKVVLASPEGIQKTIAFSDLLPFAFGSEDL